MKYLLFILFLISQTAVLAQRKIKKVLLEGKGKPVLLLNGGTADMSVFDIHAKQLAAVYQVIRMEQFNVQYAAEGWDLPKNYSVSMETEAIKLTLDSLNIHEPIIVIGHSYGGLIALDFALHYPNLVSSLVLLEPPYFRIARANHESPEGLKKMTALVSELGPHADITEDLVKRFRCALMNCDTFDIRSHPLWATWIKQKNRLRGLSATANYHTSLKKIHRFTKLVLLITGSETVPFHKRINELLAKEFPFTKSAQITGGHTAVNTNPTEFIQLLLSFLQ